MELISPLLRTDFREFCVSNFVLRQINDIFTMAGIDKGRLSMDRQLSGQRRNLVEEYYAGINWQREADIDKFLKVLGYALAQSYLSPESKQRLISFCEREGIIIDGINLYLKPPEQSARKYRAVTPAKLSELKEVLLKLEGLEARKRGFEFEKFLNSLFEAFSLKPRGSFRLVGEQIDGSFELNNDIYLIEAKWESSLIGQSDLLVFREKVESKSTWSRGLFISNSGFTQDGIDAFSRGRATNIIGMTGQDLYFILSGEISLAEAIASKVRIAGESGDFYISIFELLRS